MEIKISLSQIKNTVESDTKGVEKVQERISGLKEKIDVKEKTEESSDKRLKN
jgi:hypothetical protein